MGTVDLGSGSGNGKSTVEFCSGSGLGSVVVDDDDIEDFLSPEDNIMLKVKVIIYFGD